MILDVRKNTANEIIYTESGFTKLNAVIYKKQLSFYRKFKNRCDENPNSSISHVFHQAMDANTFFLRHYKKLDREFQSIDACYTYYLEEHKSEMKTKMQEKCNANFDIS